MQFIVGFFSFGSTSQEQEKLDMMDFMIMTTNILQGLMVGCVKYTPLHTHTCLYIYIYIYLLISFNK